MPALPAVCLVVLLEVLCLGSIFPVISYYCSQLGGNAAWLGFMWALISGPKVVMNPLWGRLSDRWGRRPVLAIATVGTMSGSALWALAPGLGWLAISRAVNGIFGAHAGLAQAVGADVSPPEKRAASMGMLGAAFGVGITLGPLIGGIVSERYSYAAVGWLCATLEAISLLIICFVLPETRPATPAPADSATADLRKQERLLHRPGVLPLLIVTLVMTLGFAHTSSTYPLIAEHWYRFSPRQTGYALAVLGLIGVLIQGGGIRPLVQRYGEPLTAVIGLATLIAGFAVIAAHPATAMFWVATGLIAAGSSLAMPPLTALLSRCVGPEDQGGIMGLNQAVTGLGRAASVVLGGLIYQKLGAPMPYAAGAIVILVAGVLLWRGKNRHA
jgi:MFS transporter, DHA1 family, tetracycline resistance protein